MKHVIIGNGPAGVIAAETLRKEDPAAGIVLIGDEPEPPYSRMAIPYLLEGQIDEAGTRLRKSAGHFDALKIRLVAGRATALDTKQRTVTLDGGKSFGYDRLLIATGSHPNRPPISGADLPQVLPCWTLADARAIMRRAKKGARVLQMGAGFIGCIILESLKARGVELTLVEMGNRLVPRMMSETAGGLIKRWVETRGVRVLTSTRVEKMEPAGKDAVDVTLSDGSHLTVDLVVNATGVAPNVDFLKSSGIRIDAGVLVDETGQTSVAGVYAAGDVSQAAELFTGAKIVNAIQPTAAEEARLAALNMAGRRATSGGQLVMNVLDTMGLISTSFGQWMGVEGGEGAEFVDESEYRYLQLQFHGDRLVGANCLGLTEHVGVLRGLIQTGSPLGRWKATLLRDPTRIVEAYLARAQGAAAA
ncbi:MAG: NAD(P)/FAD-dependent oxidoreductase [Pseudomonadota bacterium]